jgi:hypothetical protein
MQLRYFNPQIPVPGLFNCYQDTPCRIPASVPGLNKDHSFEHCKQSDKTKMVAGSKQNTPATLVQGAAQKSESLSWKHLEAQYGERF